MAACPPGKPVGFYAARADGLIQRVQGFYVADEGEAAVLAIAHEALSSEERPLDRHSLELDGEEVHFAFVKIPTENLAEDVAGWRKVNCLPADIPVRELLKAYYRLDKEVHLPSTDSMRSAASQARGSRDQAALDAEVKKKSRRGGAGSSAQMNGAGPPQQRRSPILPEAEGLEIEGDDELDDFAAEAADEDGFLEGAARRAQGLWNLKGSGGGLLEGVLGSEDGGDDLDYNLELKRLRAAQKAQGPAAAGRARAEATRLGPLGSLVGSGQLGATDLQTLALLQAVRGLSSRDSDNPGDGLTGAGKSLQRLNKMQDRVTKQPKAVVSDYLREVRKQLGVEPGEAWQLWQYSQKIPWGRMKGLHRMHYHQLYAVTLSLRGEQEECQAFMVQMLRAGHQCSIDNGSWDTASLLIPRKDPISRLEFGGTHRELETIFSYQKALKELKKTSDAPGGGGGGGDKSAKGSGKGNDKQKDKKGGGGGDKNAGEGDGTF